jgi:manganese efflux pump family protein
VELKLITEAIVFGFILSADSFSVAMVMGFRPFTRFQALSFALTSGFAEAISTFAGAVAGVFIFKHFSAYDHWVAFTLLALVAVHMLCEGAKGVWQARNQAVINSVKSPQKFHHFSKIILVSFVTSFDALGVGLSLGVGGKPLTPFILSIFACGVLSTFLGLFLARKFSRAFGPILTIAGAVALFAMALNLLKL